jgi:uncharacterized membrane protein HdeD (DUF308 family)
MKLYVGITGIPAASAEDVLREAGTPAYRSYRSKDSVDRAARRARWWWLRLFIGIGLLCLTSPVRGPVALTVVWGLLGAILVLSGLVEGYLHVRFFAKKQDSSR